MSKRPKPGAFDGSVQLKTDGLELVRGQIGGNVCVISPAHDDPRERLGDEKAIPGIDDPRSLGLQMKSADGRTRNLRQLDGAHLGFVDGTARSVGSKDGWDVALEHTLEA